MTGPLVLDRTLSTEFVPGTNLNGELACVDWRFLLPSLQFQSVLFVGVPSLSTLLVLSKFCRLLFVASNDAPKLQELQAECRQREVSNVLPVAVARFDNLPFGRRSMGLILLRRDNGRFDLIESAATILELSRILDPDGAVYFEVNGLFDGVLAARLRAALPALQFGAPQVLWLTPQSGEMRTAAPLQSREVAKHLIGGVILGQSSRSRTYARIGLLLAHLGLLPLVFRRRAMVIRHAQTKARNSVPHYLLSLGHENGIDLGEYQWSLSVRGKYNSNKVIFFLFKNSEEKPTAVVKLTRTAEFNYRLQNEYDALSMLSERAWTDRGAVPRPWFFGYRHGLAVLCQEAVDGQPFRTRTTGEADCPLARAAITCITQLGSASAHHSAALGCRIAGALNQLLSRFAAIYEPSGEELSFLKAQIATFDDPYAQIPLVFQHGDPGTWNIMVSENGKISLIDWEAGDPNGMPLWDLLYFIRSFGSWISRRRRFRDSLKGFARNFLEPSPLSALLTEATSWYCVCVGLDEKFIEPLFYTCWMHRAIKESTRLNPSSVRSGHYVNLLRLCMSRRDTSPLRLMFSKK